MSIRRRSFLTASAAAAVLAVAGCGGNEVIPLADVPPPPESTHDKSKDPKVSAPANQRSPTTLKYQ